jgi:hypothetical protein
MSTRWSQQSQISRSTHSQTKKRGRKKPAETATDPLLKQKLDKIAELQTGINILRNRMKTSKQDLVKYFEQHRNLKNSKFMAGNSQISYVDKKQTTGLSQKLIVSGLTEYFRNLGVPNVKNEVSQAMGCILNQRTAKIVPTIDIKSI